jgi:hypothetical protein
VIKFHGDGSFLRFLIAAGFGALSILQFRTQR